MNTPHVPSLALEDFVIENDRKLLISTGRSRHATQWENREFTWRELLSRLSEPTRTRETAAEYADLPKGERDQIKDVGGFVAGYLQNGRRNNASVISRSAVCLDADNADEALIQDAELQPFTYAIYSTHSHTPEHMRLRVVIPLARDVSPDEYAAISRRIAGNLGLEKFDPTTFEPSRLMYWPSTPQDGVYAFIAMPGPLLNPDDVLATYADWHDASLWPTTRPMEERAARAAGKQEDPLTKPGLIGAFCRAHPISQLLDTVLRDQYRPTRMEHRYTYTGGTTEGGMVVYEDKFAYSHHATDPSGGKLCNAFDLVRYHRYPPGGVGADGKEVRDEKASLSMMQEYAAADEATRLQLAEDRRVKAKKDFTDTGYENHSKPPDSEPDVMRSNHSDPDWETRLEYDKRGELKDTLSNIACILRHDPRLEDISYNIHRSGIDIRRHPDGSTSLPWEQVKAGWNEQDFGALLMYMEQTYRLYSPGKVKSILLSVACERAYHPVREYIESCSWDGIPRVETVLMDYLGAPDTVYHREVGKKMLVAAVARVYEPGIKFDSVVVLVGPQGMGKSSFFSKLGRKWFSDSLTIGDMKDKTAPEKLQGYWILELGELAGLKKMDVETVKAFITRQDDKFRHSYGYSVEDHPRQCVIVGSTNTNEGFLRDITGNRRFWPVNCTLNAPNRPWEVEKVVDQLWAEAFLLYRQGEKLYLTPEVEAMAAKEQTAAIETDPREGMIAEYLEQLLPEDWERMDLAERRGYLRGDTFTGGNRKGTVRREVVSAVEVWAECFCKDPTTIKRSDTYDIFGMIMKIGGWAKYGGNKSSTMRRVPYGPQRVFVRENSVAG